MVRLLIFHTCKYAVNYLIEYRTSGCTPGGTAVLAEPAYLFQLATIISDSPGHQERCTNFLLAVYDYTKLYVAPIDPKVKLDYLRKTIRMICDLDRGVVNGKVIITEESTACKASLQWNNVMELVSSIDHKVVADFQGGEYTNRKSSISMSHLSMHVPPVRLAEKIAAMAGRNYDEIYNSMPAAELPRPNSTAALWPRSNATQASRLRSLRHMDEKGAGLNCHLYHYESIILELESTLCFVIKSCNVECANLRKYNTENQEKLASPIREYSGLYDYDPEPPHLTDGLNSQLYYEMTNETAIHDTTTADGECISTNVNMIIQLVEQQDSLQERYFYGRRITCDPFDHRDAEGRNVHVLPIPPYLQSISSEYPHLCAGGAPLSLPNEVRHMRWIRKSSSRAGISKSLGTAERKTIRYDHFRRLHMENIARQVMFVKLHKELLWFIRECIRAAQKVQNCARNCRGRGHHFPEALKQELDYSDYRFLVSELNKRNSMIKRLRLYADASFPLENIIMQHLPATVASG